MRVIITYVSFMLEPAKTVTEICGGVAELARLAECSYSVALRFSHPKSKRGNGGFIPISRAQIILRNAIAEKVPLLPEHFFDRETVEALKASQGAPA